MHPINHAVRALAKGGSLPYDGGFVYFISDGEAIKIGFSEKPNVRFSGLQSAHVKQLTLLGTAPAKIHSEYDVHQRFAHLRIRGEWFQDSPELRLFIEECKELKALPEIPTAAAAAAGWLKWMHTQRLSGGALSWAAQVAFWLNMLKNGETPERKEQLRISLANFEDFRRMGRSTPSVI